MHVSPGAQVPHVPPQPFDPHVAVAHAGTHAQIPWMQVLGGIHAPHVPPQPSSPHVLPAHLGKQQAPLTHVPAAHVPHVAPQPSLPHCLAVHLGTHTHLPDLHDSDGLQ